MEFSGLRLFFLLLMGYITPAEPLLVVVLMVKNESSVIVETLQPFVDGGIQDFLIFDTGSTDGTQEVVKDFFSTYNDVRFHVIEEPFIDFSTSRNHALAAAESLFPQAIFMLMPDAEWYIKNVEGLIRFCSDNTYDYHVSYLISLQNGAFELYTSRLIRCHKGVRFTGVVHEVLNRITLVKLPNNIFFEWRPSNKGKEKSCLRWQRDLHLLLKSYEENPYDPRTLFYLAQTYECLGDYENAYIYYQKRTEIIGWDEEDFIAWFRLAGVAQQLDARNDTEIFPIAIQYYLKAFQLRPHRAEPLIKIAHYYLVRDDMHLAFLFACRACKISYPSRDILFIEKHLYDLVRYDILAKSALHIQEYEVGQWALKQALKRYPDSLYLKNQLSLFTRVLDYVAVVENKSIEAGV